MKNNLEIVWWLIMFFYSLYSVVKKLTKKIIIIIKENIWIEKEKIIDNIMKIYIRNKVFVYKKAALSFWIIIYNLKYFNPIVKIYLIKLNNNNNLNINKK